MTIHTHPAPEDAHQSLTTEDVRKLLGEATPGKWQAEGGAYATSPWIITALTPGQPRDEDDTQGDIYLGQGYTGTNEQHAVADVFLLGPYKAQYSSEANAKLMAAAPDLARLVLDLHAQLQQEQAARADLKWRSWQSGNDSGWSSESLMCAHHGVTPRYGWFEPADSDDFGRCYRLIRLFPQVRSAVDLLAQNHAGWAALAPIWDELTKMADEAGMQVRGKFSPQIHRRIHEVRWPAYHVAPQVQAGDKA